MGWVMEHLAAFYRGRRVLITGHTGFKGAWLSFLLKHLKAEVIGYALPPPTNPNLFSILHLEGKMHSVLGDVCDCKNLFKMIRRYKPELIFHMAAQSLVKRSYLAPRATFATNIMGTVHVCEAVRMYQFIRALVVVTSDKCYEQSSGKKIFSEEDSMGGFDPYSSSKGCAELVVRAYERSYFSKVSTVSGAIASARAGNVIGGGDWAVDRIIPDCVRAFLKNKPIVVRCPDSVRPWQHVFDPLYGYLLLGKNLLESGKKFSGGWNFGPCEGRKTVKWLVTYMIRLWGRTSGWIPDKTTHPHEAEYLRLNCQKANKKLRWFASWNITRAVRETMAWYKAYYAKVDMWDFSLGQLSQYIAGRVKR